MATKSCGRLIYVARHLAMDGRRGRNEQILKNYIALKSYITLLNEFYTVDRR